MNSFACVFPGQGSQSIGMMSGLVHLPVVEQTFAEASEILKLDLMALVQSGEASTLNQTANTQPAMLAAGVATWRAWQQAGGTLASTYAGHSLGEWTALVATDVLSFADAIALVSLRGEHMQAAVPEGTGAMAAILGLDNEVVEQLAADLSQSDQVVVAANYNSPGQIVVSGHQAAVESLCEQAKTAGAKRALLLPVSVPSHSPLMTPAIEPVQQALSAAANDALQASVVSFDGELYADAADICERLPQQLVSPIRWDRIATNLGKTHSLIIESGPGKVLTGLNKRILKGSGVEFASIFDEKSIDNTLELMQKLDQNKKECSHG